MSATAPKIWLVDDERNGPQRQHLTGRTEQLQLALADVSLPGPFEQLGGRVLDERFGVPGVPESERGEVAELFLAVSVDDDDAVGNAVEREREPPVHTVARFPHHLIGLGARGRGWSQPNRPVM